MKTEIRMFACCLIMMGAVEGLCFARGGRATAPRSDIYVSVKGRDSARGTKSAPKATLGAALSLVPDPLTSTVTIRMAPGTYKTAGMRGGASRALQLEHRMKNSAQIRIMGTDGAFAKPAKPGEVRLDWTDANGRFLIRITEGTWTIENVQLGSRKKGQRRGIGVTGPAFLHLKNVRIRTRSIAAPGIYANRAGRIHLYGAIELNEDLHDGIKEKESWSSIVADDHGSIQFAGSRASSSLSIGNGNLCTQHYGRIGLGCKEAKITSWGTGQQNNLSISSSGRIDLHGTTTILYTKNPANTPLGFEDDGHLLGEGAHLIVHAEGCNGILLMKASRFFCYDIEYVGKPKYFVHSTSGSTFSGCFVGTQPVGLLYAEKGSDIIVLKAQSEITGPFVAKTLGRICLPDGREFHSEKK